MATKQSSTRSFASVRCSSRNWFVGPMLLGVFGQLLANPSIAEPAIVQFDIPAQSVSSALRAFARQANVQLLVSTEGLDEVQANAVVGQFDPQFALQALLAGTGLRARYGSDATISVRRDSKVLLNSVEANGAQTPLTLLADADIEAGDQSGSQTSRSNQGSGDLGQPSDGSDGPDSTIEEIIVTGSHIRGVDNVGAASITITREELNNAGFSSLEEVFEALPQNLAEIDIDGISADGVSDIAARNTELTAGISLRGLGPTSTLVLLNGKRRPASLRGSVVDVSAIPLSMVERIELVTGGHSAIYGSDAVAGVVNIVTVTDFDGAETQVYYGEASAGAEKFNFSQTFGRNLGRGSFVLGYDYRKDRELDATDTGFVLEQSIAGASPVPGLYRIRVPSEQHIGLFSGHYDVSDKVEFYTDMHFSADENEGGQVFDFLGLFELGGIFITDSDQYSAVGGIRFDLGSKWRVDVSGLRGVVDNTIGSSNFFGPSGTFTSLNAEPTSVAEDETVLTSFSVIADGPLGRVFGEPVMGAIGIDFREESYDSDRTDVSTGSSTQVADIDREIFSVFGELHLPLIRQDNQRLEASIAGRYDDYSDFGGTFNPQLGIEWEPIAGLTIHGSFAEAFRAPEIATLADDTFGQVQILDDPLNPGTTAALFSVTGGNSSLEAENADTWSLGVDWQLSGKSRLSASYFNIEYENRIDAPAEIAANALIDESLFPGLVTRNPTPNQLDLALGVEPALFTNNSGVPFDPAVDDPYATFSNVVLFDNRRNNIGLEAVDGLDFQASTVVETASGDWSFDLNGIYYLDFTRNITVNSPAIEQINRPGRPVDLKLRGHAGWSRSAWKINAYINYVDSYEDTIAATPTSIGSWTTIDLTLLFDGSQIANSGPLAGLRVTFRVDNALDKDPPFFASNLFGLAFDGVNASPLGRFVSLRLSKDW